jgi:hypothetical protein
MTVRTMRKKPEPVTVDFIANLRDAWNGAGKNTLAPPAEHKALLALASLPAELWQQRWEEFTAEQRRQLLYAARRAVELGRACAWMFTT